MLIVRGRKEPSIVQPSRIKPPGLKVPAPLGVPTKHLGESANKQAIANDEIQVIVSAGMANRRYAYRPSPVAYKEPTGPAYRVDPAKLATGREGFDHYPQPWLTPSPGSRSSVRALVPCWNGARVCEGVFLKRSGATTSH